MICEQEDCEFWAGQGCVCQWMDTKSLELVAVGYDEDHDMFTTFYRRREPLNYSGLDRSFDDHAGMGQ